MKKTIFFVAIALIVLSACTEDFDYDERGFELQELPAYVAFNSAGTSVSLAPIEASEDDEDPAELSVEVPGGTLSDVTVNYTFGGNAVFGEDFTIEGATSSGGSVVIETTLVPNLNDEPLDATIEVVLLSDGVQDGDKTLEITLTSASNAEGELAVGRGGTEALRTATVIIADADAPEEEE